MSITSQLQAHYQLMVKKNVDTTGDFHALSVKMACHLLKAAYLLTVYQVINRYKLMLVITFSSIGPPSALQLYSNGSNIVCFEAYSHPDYPIEFFLLNITSRGIHQQVTRQYVLNSSQCADLTQITECSTLQASVMANNSLGFSSQVSFEGIILYIYIFILRNSY